MKYHLITYGCQMNKSDSERIAAVLENTGLKPASNEKEADLIVVNACSVRQSAIDRIWGKVRQFEKLKKENSNLKTILTGCVLKEDKRKFAKLFDLILDIRDLPKLPQKLSQKLSVPCTRIRLDKEQKEKDYFENYLEIESKYQTSFSAFVPIMAGCNNFCSFCVVPYVRGREISRPAEKIICQVRNLIRKGFKEIWLLGQNVNSYRSRLTQISRRNNAEINFPKLLRMVNDIPGNFWIRFTSSHPKDFSDELIEAMAELKKVTPYLNLPVQSGDNEILRKMNRPYTIERYKGLVKKIRQKIPEITISTDVIVGFPGETEKQFQNTVKLFKEIKYDMAYIAQYSPRPGTAAVKLKDDVPKKEKERREKILTEILKETALENNKKYIGKIAEALPKEEKNGFLIGKIRAYKTLKVPISNIPGPSEARDSPKGCYPISNLVGQFVKVKITNALPWGLKGKIVRN